MRILHAVRSDGFAGVERHVARLARAQAAAGHRVVVVGGDPEQMRATLQVAAVDVHPARSTLDVVRALRRLATGADVLHVHMTAAEVAATVAAAATRAFPPVVTTRHFAGRRGSGRAGRLIAALARRRVTAQVSISRYVADHVDGDSVVVHPGVEDRPDGRTAGERSRVVLMVQRLESEKRSDLGLRAFAASGLAEEGWELHVAGDGSQRSVLESLCTELGVDSHVRFLGARTDVDQLMADAGLLVAPCPVEGLGLSVLEAMAGGLPVVAASAGGHLELLEGVDPLTLYPPYDTAVAGRHLAALARDPARRDAVSAAARTVQRTSFTPHAQVAGTDAVYRSVVGAPRATGRTDGGRELVVVSLEAWDDVWRRNQYLVAGLARADPGLRVLFVEPAADPLYQLTRRTRPRLGRGLRPAGPVEGIAPDRLLLYQPTKPLPRRLDRRADARLASGVRRAVRRAGFLDPFLWVNDPSAASLITTTAWPSLYDVTDDWLAAHRTPEEHRRLVADEATLLERCDEVVVCSPHLARIKGAERPVHLVTNGVDLERYRRPAQRPADLPDGPVALYVGTVHPDRFDVDLTVATAQDLAGQAVVVLVGPVLDLDAGQVAALDRAGVVRLGPRPWTAVPAYLQHATVLLVPHLVNEFTDSLDPIKLYEYRAVGRPVVSTLVAGFRDGTDPLVTAVSAEDFPAAVGRALRATPHSSSLPPGAGIPTWSQQATTMRRIIDGVGRPASTPR